MNNKDWVDKLILAAEHINRVSRNGSGNYTVVDSDIARFLIGMNRVDKIKRIKVKLKQINR